MKNYRNTVAMNIVGAVGITVLCVALFFNKLGEQPAAVLLIIVVFYLGIVSVPAGTARGLSDPKRTSLQYAMLVANWALIAFWVLGLLVIILVDPHRLGMAVGAALFYVVPQAINIRALRSIIAAQKTSLEHSTPMETARQSNP